MLGELGGHDEYSLVEALKSGKIKKPVVAWVSGTCAKLFKTEVQFGHAGAKSGGASESAQVGLHSFSLRGLPGYILQLEASTDCSSKAQLTAVEAITPI